MFGPRYTVKVGERTIEMGPPSNKAEVEQFAGPMSNPRVSRYLGRQGGFVPEDETEWYEKIRNDSNDVTWMLFDVSDGARVLIGDTGYHFMKAPLKTAISGCAIVRPEYWGKGVAGATHRVRTWHAFARDMVVCLRSAVFEPNVGSRRALESVGYVVVAEERNQGVDDGKLISKLNLECVNPSPLLWDLWWSSESPPDSFCGARSKTEVALQWVRDHVQPLDG